MNRVEPLYGAEAGLGESVGTASTLTLATRSEETIATTSTDLQQEEGDRDTGTERGDTGDNHGDTGEAPADTTEPSDPSVSVGEAEQDTVSHSDQTQAAPSDGHQGEDSSDTGQAAGEIGKLADTESLKW